MIPFYDKTRGTHGYGVDADKPAATDVWIGALYFSTDTGVVWRSNGTTWDTYSLMNSAGAAVTPEVNTGTSDGSDDKNLVLAGAGAAGASRGGWLQLHGNEDGSNPGDIVIQSGASGTDRISLRRSSDFVEAFGTDGASGLLYANFGLEFPTFAPGSPAPNDIVLDRVQRGTWSPIIGGDGGTSGQSYTNQIGSYFRIGPLVVCSFFVELSTKGTITGNLIIGNLPFTASAHNYFHTAAVNWFNTVTNFVNMMTLVENNQTYASLKGTTAAGTSSNNALSTSDIGNSTGMTGTIIYLVG